MSSWVKKQASKRWGCLWQSGPWHWLWRRLILVLYHLVFHPYWVTHRIKGWSNLCLCPLSSPCLTPPHLVKIITNQNNRQNCSVWKVGGDFQSGLKKTLVRSPQDSYQAGNVQGSKVCVRNLSKAEVGAVNPGARTSWQSRNQNETGNSPICLNDAWETR